LQFPAQPKIQSKLAAELVLVLRVKAPESAAQIALGHGHGLGSGLRDTQEKIGVPETRVGAGEVVGSVNVVGKAKLAELIADRIESEFQEVGPSAHAQVVGPFEVGVQVQIVAVRLAGGSNARDVENGLSVDRCPDPDALKPDLLQNIRGQSSRGW
jgi:hypothetical protein